MKSLKLVLCILVSTLSLKAQRVGDLVQLDGVRDNQLSGYGIVVGLPGTGDKTAFTQSTLRTYLDNNGIKLPQGVNVRSKNIAAVIVTANLPSFASVGQRLDVTVSSIGDAKSLRGGTLIMTPLKGVDGQIYAVSQGSMLVSGLDESGADGSKITVNVSSVGRIPSGATVEVPFEAKLVQGGALTMTLKNPSFELSSRIVSAINDFLGYRAASSKNHSKLTVSVPDDQAGLVDFVTLVQSVEVDLPRDRARVVVNSRTGTVVITDTVYLSPVAITHGGITLEVQEIPAEQGLLNGQDGQSDISITENSGRMFNVAGTDLRDIVSSFNEMGLAPSDVVAILDALKTSGSLSAELEII